MNIDELRKLYLIIFKFEDGTYKVFEDTFYSVHEARHKTNQLSAFGELAKDEVTAMYIITIGDIMYPGNVLTKV